MKRLFIVAAVAAFSYGCGPSSSTTNDNNTSVSSSPTGDTAITDHGTGAAKGAETRADTTSTAPGSDTTTNQ